jgi:VWFA-related protein
MKISFTPSTTHLSETNCSRIFALAKGGSWLPLLLMLALGVCADFVQSQTTPQSATQTPKISGAINPESEMTTRITDAQIKVHVNLVLVRAIVRDATGKEVAGFKKEDFKLLDNGKEQRIATFNVETPETRRTGAVAATVETAENSRTEEAADTSNAATANARETKTSAGGKDEGASAETLPQRFVALVFDDLHMKVNESLAVRAATERLFASLAPTDRTAIYSTSGDVQQGFTGDAEALRKALATIIPRPGKGEGEMECPNITYYMADLIYNKRDAQALSVAWQESQSNCPLTRNDILASAQHILQVADQTTRADYQNVGSLVKHMAAMPGQRVLVYVSPGFIVGSDIQSTTADLIELAVRDGIVVNTIDARGLYTADYLPDIAAPPVQPPDKTQVDWQGIEGAYRMQAQFEQGQVLASLAASTGGTYFHNRNDLGVAMNQAMSAPSVSYLLGFSPQNLKMDGKFHKLKVTIENGQKCQIQAREGYYAPKMLADPEEMMRQEVRSALFEQDQIVDLPIDLKTQFFKTDSGSAQLSVLTRMDIKGIHFRKADGRNYNNVILATAVFDSNGQFVKGEIREIAMKLLDSSVQRLSTTGLTVKISFSVKPGTYLVRSVVGASEGEQLTARNAMTVIP